MRSMSAYSAAEDFSAVIADGESTDPDKVLSEIERSFSVLEKKVLTKTSSSLSVTRLTASLWQASIMSNLSQMR